MIIKARSVKRMLLILGVTVAAVTSIGLAALIYPFAPSGSSSIRFDGFIVLPRRTSLSVLDYMTLNGRDLFVAGTSIGSLFKVKLDPREHGTGKAVLELAGALDIHGDLPRLFQPVITEDSRIAANSLGVR